MSTFGLIEFFIILILLYVAFRDWIRRRWPLLEKKIKISLFASAAFVVIYKIVITIMARN